MATYQEHTERLELTLRIAQLHRGIEKSGFATMFPLIYASLEESDAATYMAPHDVIATVTSADRAGEWADLIAIRSKGPTRVCPWTSNELYAKIMEHCEDCVKYIYKLESEYVRGLATSCTPRRLSDIR